MSYTLIEERAIKSARKWHRCNWCGGEIKVGEPYVRERSIFEGDPQTNQFHPECAEACKEAARDSDGDFCYDSWSMPRGRVDWDQTESTKRAAMTQTVGQEQK